MEEILQPKYIIIFTVVIVILALLITIIVFFKVSRKTIAKEEKAINKYFKISYNYVINYKERTVQWFDLKDTSKINSFSFDEFLGIFEFKEHSVIDNWLYDCLNAKDLQDKQKVLLTTEIKKIDKRNFIHSKVVLEITQLDKEKSLIYLTKNKLRHLPLSIKKRGSFGKVKIDHKYIITQDEFVINYNKDIYRKGTMYYIMFIKKKDKFSSYNEKRMYYEMLDIFFKTIPDADIYSFLNESNSLDIFILDNRFFSNIDIKSFLEKLSNEINAYQESAGYKNVFDNVIVSAKAVDLKRNFDEMYKSLNKYALSLYEEKKLTGYYYPQSKEVKTLEQTYNGEVNKVLRNESIDIYYKPIIRIHRNKVNIVGYQSFSELKESTFADYNEFIKYANQFDLKKEAFGLSFKKAVSSFVSQNDNVLLKLFFLIELGDIPYANRLFPHVSNLKDANLVLVFKNNEFIDFEDDEEYIHTIKTLQSKGYECALLINLNDYTLKDNTYKLFDYFLFDFNSFSGLKQTSRDFVKVHSLLEKFVKFNTPMMCLNANSWSIIDMLFKSGITYFSSDVICPKNTLLLPIEKKVNKKLINMINK